MTKLPKGYVSFTQLSLFGGFFGCELAYFYRYVEGRKVGRPNTGLLLGGVWDDAINKLHEYQLEHPDDPLPQDLAPDTVGTVWDWRLSQEEYDLRDAGKDLRGRTQAASKVYQADTAPRVKPTVVQREVSQRLETGARLFGKIDLLEDRGGLLIVDNKATASNNKKFDGSAAVADLQLSLYDLCMSMEGEEVLGRGWRYLRMLPSKAEQGESFVRADVESRERTKVLLGQIVARMEEACESGLFLPTAALQQSYKCSAKFCEFFPAVCPFGARARKVMPLTVPKGGGVSFPIDALDEALPE